MSAEHIPEIPGYHVLQPLGRGGMASVYLAIQESVDREVALKIMAPQLSLDPSFGERFLREARIAAKLHHRHVVSIFDVGVHNGFHYCTMEYMPGGPVMRRGSPPLALKPALRCVREIALALNYAQGKGFIHRDVKPDNILLREDGSCVLGDFGIARAADSGTMMTKAGSVVGTPYYMSPEQLRGREIDGRADLYSLGVVFFQLVTGKVPFEASDSLAIGIMHMTAPLPQLPSEYRMLQPVLDRMLAKEPGDRYQTGAEIEAALGEIEKRMASGRNDPPAKKPAETPPPAVPPRRESRTAGYDTQGSLRTEPKLGQIDVADDAMRATPRPQNQTSKLQAAPVSQPGPRRPMGWIVAIAALVGVGIWQEPLISSWLQPKPDSAQNPSERADQALDKGDLFGDSGLDALSLYAAALQMDAADQRAIAGLTKTINALHAQLAAAQPIDQAKVASIIERLRKLPPVYKQAERFQALLDSANAKPDPGGLAAQAANADLQAAQRAESSGQLDGASGALARFAAAQSLDPANEQARRGVERVAGALAAQAQTYLAAGDLASAERLYRELAALPALGELAAALKKDLAAKQAAVSGQQKIPSLLAEASRLANQGRWVEPAGASAADRYRAVLAIDAKNAAAQRGLTQAANAALSQFDSALAARDFDRAGRLLKRVQSFAPRANGLNDAKERLDRAKASITPDKQIAHDKLIAEGQQALASDQLLEPVGDAAYDKFRGALAIDPRSTAARAGMDRIAQALRQRIDENLAAGRATKADANLAALETVAPLFTGVPELKRRIAEAYAKNGLRSLERGSVADARSDLNEAERLDPNEPSVVRLRSELVGR